MNKKARLNYINALSSQVERKKMYKAKKQWVVAGISFLVATGMGAIGSHLTTHADATNGTSQQTTLVAPKLASGSASHVNNQKSTNNMKQSSGSAIQNSANQLHANILANAQSSKVSSSSNNEKPVTSPSAKNVSAQSKVAPHFNSAYENYLKANPQLASLYSAIGNSQQTSNNLKPNSTSANSNKVNNKKIKKPLVLTGQSNNDNALTIKGAIVNNNKDKKGNPQFKTSSDDLNNDTITGIYDLVGFFKNGPMPNTDHIWGYLVNINASDTPNDMSASPSQFLIMNDDDNDMKYDGIWYRLGNSYTIAHADWFKMSSNYDLYQLQSTLQSQINSINSKITADESKIGTDESHYNQASANANKALGSLADLTNGSVKANSTNASNLSKALSTLEGKVGGDESKITADEANITKNGTNVGTLSGEYTKLDGDYTNLSTDIGKVSGIAAQASNAAKTANGTANANKGWINNNSGSLASAYSWAKSASTSADNAISSLNADSSALNWLVNSLASVESESTQVTSNQNWIHNNSASVSSLSQSFADVYSKIRQDSNTLNQAIDSKANTSDLTNKYDALSRDIVTASSLASDADKLANGNQTWINNSGANASAQANDADSWVKAQSASLSNASTTAQSALTSANDALNSLKSVASAGSVQALSNEIYSADGLKDRISDLERSIDSSNTSSGLSALAKDYSTLSNDIYGSNSIASQVSNANSWVNKNGSTVSNEAKSASGTATANATAISSLSGKVANDENSIASASSSANSALGKATTAITSLGQLTTTVDGNSRAISSLQDNYSNLSSEISDENQAMVTLATTISSDETKIGSNATALSTLNTDLTNEESILSADAQNASNLASDADKLAKQNADDIKALKSNTAITLTFMNGNKQYHSPVTLTKGYIEDNGKVVSSNESKSTATYDITSLLNLNLRGYYASDYQVTIAPNASNGIASVSLKDVDGNASNGGKKLYALNESLGAELSSQLNDDEDAKKNIIHIHGVPVQYKGTITINFNTGKSDKTTVHTETIPYTINTHVDAQNINILNQANSNINNPSDYLNNITDFDTSNFKYDSANANSDGKYTINDVANNIVPTSYVYDPKTQKPATTITTINPVINFKAEAATEHINYKNGSDEVGSSNESGYTDENGDVTSINDANISKKYKLVNANNNFIFTNGGSVDVPVVSTNTNPALSPENNHSNVPNKKPADMSHSITVTINDLDSKGHQINQYPRYVTITGSKGYQFDLKPSDYVTTGYINKPNSNQDITGTVTGNGLKTNTGTTWNFYAAESAGKINNPNNKTITPSTNNVPSDNQKPEKPVPSDVNKPSDNTPVKPKAPNNPQNNDNETNTKHAIATIYIVRTRNGKNISISSKTYDMNNEPVNYKYDITPQDVQKDVNLDGYKVDSHDKDLSGIIQADGSLSNGTATFYYDVDSNQIEPMEVVYKNSDGDYISHAKTDSGKDLGKDITKASEAIQPITSQELATLGTVSESVNVQQFITAPLGYYLDGSNNYNVTLQQAHKDSFGKEAAYVLTVTMPSKNNPNGEMNTQTSTVNSDVKTAQNWASNSSFSDATRSSISDDIKSMNADNSSAEQFSGEGTDGSKSAQQYFNSASSAYNNASSLATSASASVQSSVSASNSSASASVASLASLVANDVKSNQPANTGKTSLTSDEEQAIANDIDGNIKSTTSVVTNTVVDHSALDSLTNEVATNNSEINSLANKPTPTATVNYNNFDNLINNGIDRLEDTINKDFKANISNVHAQSVKPRRNIGKRTYSYLKWLRVVKPLKLYNNNHKAVKVIKPRHRITLNVKAAYKVHNHIVFKVSYRNHNYFIKANNKAIKNAYFPASKKLVGRKVRVLYNVYANKHKTSGRVKTLHKGYKSIIKNIVRIGNHNVTRIQLADGLWISANMNYVEVL